MKIIATPNELIDNGLWNQVCTLTGTNPWAVNEGFIHGDQEYTFESNTKNSVLEQGK